MMRYTHTRHLELTRDITKGLCGVVRSDYTFWTKPTQENKTHLKATYTSIEEFVDCPDCKAHKFWDLWIINSVPVE